MRRVHATVCASCGSSLDPDLGLWSQLDSIHATLCRHNRRLVALEKRQAERADALGVFPAVKVLQVPLSLMPGFQVQPTPQDPTSFQVHTLGGYPLEVKRGQKLIVELDNEGRVVASIGPIQ